MQELVGTQPRTALNSVGDSKHGKKKKGTVKIWGDWDISVPLHSYDSIIVLVGIIR